MRESHHAILTGPFKNVDKFRAEESSSSQNDNSSQF
jgi:hypothetical protein